MHKKAFYILLITLFPVFQCLSIEALYTLKKPTIDGKANEINWQKAPWHSIDKIIAGELPSAFDFSGKYKVLWHESALYLLVEITDDVFFDQEKDPLKNYWNDDCLEVFIDEDNSGGNHLYSFNAFSYHVALDSNVVDIVGEKTFKSGKPALFNHHIKNQYSLLSPHKILWELEVKIYGDNYKYAYENVNDQPKSLSKNKTLGFMLSYCDNDGSLERESFMGSIDIEPVNGSKNLGYITADVFDELLLIQQD